VVITIEHLGREAKRRRREARAAGAVTTGPGRLPRAPERAAGRRPGTRRPRPMPPVVVPTRAAPAAPAQPVEVAVQVVVEAAVPDPAPPVVVLAKADAAPAAVVTVTARPAAATPAVAASTSTEEARVSAPARIPGARRPAPAGVAAEHLTEITLDDVLTNLATSKVRCLRTYDECAVLADGALRLRRDLDALAADLAERHNVIGDLTSRAMDRLSESMGLLAAKAEEMRTNSLRAAELVEIAHDDMHDAYRPIQDAAAQAGLAMPSARIHNDS
jgi:hypothetical protein